MWTCVDMRKLFSKFSVFVKVYLTSADHDIVKHDQLSIML